MVRMGETTEAYRGLMDKLEEKIRFGRPTRQQQRNMTSLFISIAPKWDKEDSNKKDCEEM